MATTAQTVQGYYQNILFRPGDQAGVQYWTNQIDNVGYTDAQVENAIATSSEAQTYVAPIVQLYAADLGRAADTSGLSYWVHQYEGGMSLSAIDTAIQTSTEGKAYIGNGGTITSANATAFVTKLYSNILDRAPDSSGLSYWVQQLTATTGALTPGQVEDAFRTSAEAQATLPAATTNYLLTIGSGGSVTGSLFNTSGTPGQTFTLMPGVDNLTGTANNDTFIGTVGGGNPTLNPGDSINGNGGTNTLKIVDTAGGYSNDLAGVTLSNVQTVSVQNASTSGDVLVDFSQSSDVSKVIALNTPYDQGDYFRGLATGTQVIASGSASGYESGSHPPNYYSWIEFGMANPSDAVSVGVDGGINGAYFYNDLNTSAPATAATITSTGATNGTVDNYNYFELTNGNDSLKTLTVNASTNLVAGLDSSDYVSTGAALKVTGAAQSVDLSQGSQTSFKTIDASQLAGGLTIIDTGANLTSFGGGSGDDSLKLTGVTPAGFTFNGGAGNNTLNVANGELSTLTSGSQLDGGTGGTNTLAINNPSLTSADYTTLNAVKDFQVLQDTAGGTLDMSQISKAGFTSEAISGTLTLNNLTATQAAAINIIGSATPTLNWTGGNSQASTIGFTVDDKATSASTVNLTPTINGTTAGSTINMDVANSNDTATVGSLTGTPNLANLTITGSGNASVTSGALTVNPSTTIDASGLTGKLTLDMSLSTARGAAIKGSVGANTITLGTPSGASVDLSANAKGGSTVYFSNAAGAGSPADTITLGTHSSADTIQLDDTAAQYGGLGSTTTLGSIETINNFTIGSTASSSDVMKFLGGTPADLADGSYTATQTGITNLTATSSNGILTFGGSAASSATLSQLIYATAALDNTAANQIGAFTLGSNTYVVESPTSAAASLSTDHVFALNGVTGVTGIGTTAAANHLLVA